RLQQHSLSPLADLDDVVKLAEEAHKAAPSSATASTLEGALLARASDRLAAKQPDYAAMAKRTRRSLGAADLIAGALWREGKLRDAALADPDVRRTLELVRETLRKFPGSPSSWMWVMLRAADPEQGPALAKALQSNEWVKMDEELSRLLSPPNASSAFH